MKHTENKYDWVKSEEANFKKPISLIDGWNWNFYEHIRLSFLYKNSQFDKNNDDRDKRPFKNIVRPILNIQYRTEGFDVKDIELYVNDAKNYYKSFLVKKFHEKWALKNEIDTFIDDLVESYVDYGGALVKNINSVRPEVVNLQSLAFCDQTDILNGPFAIKHFFSPQQLRDTASMGWGNPAKGATMSLDTLADLGENQKTQDYYNTPSSTPGKYIEVYKIHGVLPDSWLKRTDYKEESKYIPQIQIIAFYKNEKDQDTGVTLFASKEPKLPFKFLARDKIKGRALGFGGVEELFEPQIWTNYSEIQVMGMLEMASKTFYWSTDPAFKTRNNLIETDNGHIFTLGEGKQIGQVDTTPRNLVAFNNAIQEWENHAGIMGAAGESLQGVSPAAGTPFKLQELVTMEAKGLHHYRQGKIAVFVDEIYRDWVLPHISSEITKGQSFLAELSADEFQQIAESVVNNQANRFAIERILNGELVSQEEIDIQKEKIRTEFVGKGNKRFVEILKDEFKDAPIEIQSNIAGKQKNLALLTDKLVNVLRQFIATPEIRQDPQMVKLLNTILESSGMSPIMFAGAGITQQQGGGGTEPLKALSGAVKEAAPAMA